MTNSTNNNDSVIGKILARTAFSSVICDDADWSTNLATSSIIDGIDDVLNSLVVMKALNHTVNTELEQLALETKNEIEEAVDVSGRVPNVFRRKIGRKLSVAASDLLPLGWDHALMLYIQSVVDRELNTPSAYVSSLKALLVHANLLKRQEQTELSVLYKARFYLEAGEALRIGSNEIANVAFEILNSDTQKGEERLRTAAILFQLCISEANSVSDNCKYELPGVLRAAKGNLFLASMALDDFEMITQSWVLIRDDETLALEIPQFREFEKVLGN